MNIETAAQLESLDFARGGGLVPVIAQHAHTGEVLMLGYASREALECSLASGELWLYSRSRNTLWKKGETSGHVLRLHRLAADCDGDTVLAHALPAGPTCHTGRRSCFDAPPTLRALADLLERRVAGGPAGSYTVRLLEDENLRLKKLGEEAIELAMACARGDAQRAAEEAADLFYHALVACRGAGADLDLILETLASRIEA
ncbi:MAG: bifunctional phosphoribosyl-AMP cyclohydrolase/phosphoribosyl-ATP diphosphatase HisIE [Longimicrobiales bacterium]